MNEKKKLVSVVVPVCNEQAMIGQICSRVHGVFADRQEYDYEIVFFDDGSTDGTRDAIEAVCAADARVKAVFYTRNFGYLKSTFYCMQQARGDCAVILHGDLQNPPEQIPEFLEKWEQGARVVQGVKNRSRENRLMYLLRTVFYWLMTKVFRVNITPHGTEFVLLDRSFLEILRSTRVSRPFLRGIIGEYGWKTAYVYYTQDARKTGRSKFNLNKYYDFAICGITQYSRVLPRVIIGICIGAVFAGLAEFCVGFLPEAMGKPWSAVADSVILRGIFLVLCLLVMLICLMFEYIMAIMSNTTRQPLVVEEKRINY